MSRRPWGRVLYLLAAAVVALAFVVRTVHHDRGVGARPAPSATPDRAAVAPAPRSSAPEVDNEYLYAVPAQDLRAELDRCRSACVANFLAGPALQHRVAAFRGIAPLAGGTITGPDGRVIFESVEATAKPDALAHLVVRRVGARGSAPPTVDARSDDESQTVTVRETREGWEFTAILVVRDTQAPVDAAVVWASVTPLPR